MKKIKKFLILILIYNVSLFGSYSYQILKFPYDARSLSLHNGASSYKRSFLRNNPASISFDTKKYMYSYFILPANIYSMEIQKKIIKNKSVYINKFSLISYGSLMDSEIKSTFTALDLLYEIGIKKEYANLFSYGISSGYLYSSIDTYNSHIFNSKIGINSHISNKKIGLGFSLENLGLIITPYTNYKESLPSIFRTAIYYKLLYMNAIINTDIIYEINNHVKELILGFEFYKTNNLFFRFGITTNRTQYLMKNITLDILAGISTGVGLKVNSTCFDLGIMNLGPAGYIIGFSITSK